MIYMRTCSIVLALTVVVLVGSTFVSAAPVLQEIERIELPDVTGRIDHMVVDIVGKRLFVAALGNNTVEVIDLAHRRVIKSLTGFEEPQGVLLLTEQKRLLVTNGEDKVTDLIDSETLAPLGKIQSREDGDNIRYDAQTREIYIGCGSGRDSAIAVINAADMQSNTKYIALSGHPESFQLERSGKRIFVNVPTSGKVEVIDRERGEVVASWSISEQANFPMALDEAHHRLFIGTRKPAKLLVLDTETGKIVANLASVGDADDIFYVAETRRVYVSGDEGFVYIFQQQDPDRYILLDKIATEKGARTSLFVPKWNQLYVAVPNSSASAAHIRVFRIGDR
jgi:DNA-binding beta-propeller fold protein YncE